MLRLDKIRDILGVIDDASPSTLVEMMKRAKLRLQLTVALYDAIDRALIALADRLAALVERELHDADREVLRCADLTLAFRLQQPR